MKVDPGLSFLPGFFQRINRHLYFILQSALTLGLLSLPFHLDFFAVFFGILSVQAMGAFQMLAVDLAALAGVLWWMALRDVPYEGTLRTALAVLFALWGEAWLIQVIALGKTGVSNGGCPIGPSGLSARGC